MRHFIKKNAINIIISGILLTALIQQSYLLSIDSVSVSDPRFEITMESVPVYAKDIVEDTLIIRDFPVEPEYYEEFNKQYVEYKKEKMLENDPRVKRVRALYKSYNSPLADYAEYMVKVSDDFGIDYRLVPAISIIESSGGVYTYRPYNAWGWGGQSNAYTFTSWEESIYTVTKGIKEGYWDKGARTPYQMGPYYCPDTWQSWAAKVDYVMQKL